MSGFFEYPAAAAFGKVLPKNKIYGHAEASARLKQLFVDEVDQIVWQYKLAPETINLNASPAVPEIQIFSVTLRGADLSQDILSAVDKAIPFPIIFELTHAGKRKAIAAYKRPSEADSVKWVFSEYFETKWEAADTPRVPLPIALDLASLYERLLSPLIPYNAANDESLSARVAITEALRAKLREAQRINGRMKRERQFNKRVAINAELRAVTTELKNMGHKPEDNE